MTASELARRLITLIFAGRNRMDMIRRELARTNGAGWVRRQYLIVFVEGSPFRGSSTVIGAAVQLKFTMLGCLRLFLLRFGMHGDGPHESESFANDCGRGHVTFLAASRQCSESFVQPLLCLPGDLPGLR